mgnify:CR=1 FL=1
MPTALNFTAADTFIKEGLNHYDQNVIKPTYPEYWGYLGKYHQAIPGLQFGQREFYSVNKDFTGKAANFGGKAQDIPLVNYQISPTGYKTMVGASAALWNWEELEAERVAASNSLPRVPVVQSYREAMDKALQSWMHIRTVFGDPETGFTGMIDNPYVEVVELAGNNNPLKSDGGDGSIASNLHNWFCDIGSSFKDRSMLTMGAGVAALTSENVNRGLKYRFEDGSGSGTVRDLLLGLSRESTSDSSGDYRAIKIVNEMAGKHVINPDFGNLTEIQGHTITDKDDLVLMLDAAPGTAKKHYAPIQYFPVRQTDITEWKQVGFCAVTETIYDEPIKARLYILKDTKQLTGQMREFN